MFLSLWSAHCDVMCSVAVETTSPAALLATHSYAPSSDARQLRTTRQQVAPPSRRDAATRRVVPTTVPSPRRHATSGAGCPPTVASSSATPPCGASQSRSGDVKVGGVAAEAAEVAAGGGSRSVGRRRPLPTCVSGSCVRSERSAVWNCRSPPPFGRQFAASPPGDAGGDAGFAAALVMLDSAFCSAAMRPSARIAVAVFCTGKTQPSSAQRRRQRGNGRRSIEIIVVAG